VIEENGTKREYIVQSDRIPENNRQLFIRTHEYAGGSGEVERIPELMAMTG
jgi:hypothetical protein